MTDEIRLLTSAKLDRIGNSELRDALLTKANFELLEELLVEEEKRHFKLLKESWADEPYFGEPIRLDELEEIFEGEVKREVDAFLQVKSPDFPLLAIEDDLENAAGYHILQKTVVIRTGERKKSTFSQLAHEYNHHIQNKFGMLKNYDRTSIFTEGHAMGVERNVANALALSKNDLSLRWCSSSHLIYGMRSTYGWMSKLMGFRIKDDLFRKGMHNTPNDHQLGNTLFYLAEARHGKGIYADVLRGDFSSILGGTQ